MRVIVAGSRHLTDYQLVVRAIAASGFEITEVVEGGQRGIDRTARQWAENSGIPFKTIDADWDALGPAAGPIRNQKMADSGAEALIAIPCPKSSGTWDMARKARAKGLRIYVHREAL